MIRKIELIIGIITCIVFLTTIIVVAVMLLDGINACDKEKLEIKLVIIEDKFVQNKGLSGDKYYFLDENGIDYEIYNGHTGARYIKLKLNQTYQIRVNMKLGVSCEEIKI